MVSSLFTFCVSASFHRKIVSYTYVGLLSSREQVLWSGYFNSVSSAIIIAPTSKTRHFNGPHFQVLFRNAPIKEAETLWSYGDKRLYLRHTLRTLRNHLDFFATSAKKRLLTVYRVKSVTDTYFNRVVKLTLKGLKKDLFLAPKLSDLLHIGQALLKLMSLTANSSLYKFKKMTL